ncbi:MAG TPA: energy-coupling factor ABC transporter substrate-binding protein [Peptostreptococcaceae bacterium]|nr:energy-coupling factor ABC transporter substrate-binding protein [Peptostreptococcaceae bacterium]
MKQRLMSNNIVLVIIAILLIASPLIINKNAEYSGSDGKAEETITEIDPNYKPWFSSIYEPQSGEVESLLFAVQASLGTGIICYYLGYIKGKKNDSHR